MKRILITEDDALMAEIYRDSFEREGFSAEIATDGDIAIQRLKGNPPDVVLLDLMMPNVNGIEVLKHIRGQESTRGLPVIVMSNALAGALGQQAATAGATRMFAKNSCGPRRLVKEVRDVLASNTTSTEAVGSTLDPTKQLAELRKDVTRSMPQRLAEIRDLLQTVAAEGSIVRQNVLLDLHRAIHQFAGTVSFAGFGAIAQLACALETLFKEFYSCAEKISASSLRTASHAVEVLAELSERSTKQSDEAIRPSLVLVVDDEAFSRKAARKALEQAHLCVVAVDDPFPTLKLSEENRFDLIFMGVRVRGTDGFVLCRKLQDNGPNAETPVIFVAVQNDPQTRLQFNSSGAVDFITKPIWLTELGVKALTHLSHSQLSRAPRSSISANQ
jgi:CheY-like chemotaxis protein